MIQQFHKLFFSILVLILSSCSVQNLSKTQTFCNFSKSPFLVTSDNNSGVSHSSGKVRSIFGLVSWGDASIRSAINVTDSFRLGRFSRIEEERRFLFGCGYYRISVNGKYRQ